MASGGDITFDSLSVVAVAAFLAPLVIDRVRRFRIPVAVVEIVLGVVIGPHVLGWADIDEPVQVLALLGLAFVLFLAGFELDLGRLRGQLARVAGLGFVCTLACAVVVGLAFQQADLVDSAFLAAILLSATSLALVTPVLRDSRQISTRMGQLTMGQASIAEFSAVVLLSALFTKETRSVSVRVILGMIFVLLILLGGIAMARVSRTSRVERIVTRLQDGTAQIRVRGSFMLLALFVVLAQEVGLEAILGALLAGAILGTLDNGALRRHAQFRMKLDAIGYGFLLPVFFIWSGMTIDIDALREQPRRIALIGLFLAALLVVHLVAVPIFRRAVGWRPAVVTGLLSSTSSLPFVVTATTVGEQSGLITTATASALLAAGVLSALVFPVVALALVRREETEGELAVAPAPAS
ncbi:MAG TPA: cation:proton antiporter [Acidimicrobiales bacterium]|nr:cation:proton antiporter [Acidimicrobiales bacterium]